MTWRKSCCSPSGGWGTCWPRWSCRGVVVGTPGRVTRCYPVSLLLTSASPRCNHPAGRPRPACPTITLRRPRWLAYDDQTEAIPPQARGNHQRPPRGLSCDDTARWPKQSSPWPGRIPGGRGPAWGWQRCGRPAGCTIPCRWRLAQASSYSGKPGTPAPLPLPVSAFGTRFRCSDKLPCGRQSLTLEPAPRRTVSPQTPPPVRIAPSGVNLIP